MSEIEKRLKEPYMEGRIKSSEQNNKQPTNAVIEDTATQMINEYKDMERRKLNLIAFNVPESTSPETVRKKDDDINFIRNVAKEINAGGVDVVELFCPVCVYWPISVWDVPYAYTHMGRPYAYGTTFCPI